MNLGVGVKAPAHSDDVRVPSDRRTDPSNANADRPNVVPIRPGPVTGKCNVITVLIADDHPVVREGLAGLISRRPDMRVVAEASNGREAVAQYYAQRCDVGLFDLRMPVMDGIDAVLAIRKQEPAARLAIISSFQNEEDVYRAVQAGARGYVLKDSAAEELVKCILAVSDGEMWIPPLVAAKLANRVATRKLTAREIEVLHSLASGKSNKEIGNQLNISEATVKVHVTHIFEKLKVTGRTQAIGVAVSRGLVNLCGRTAA
jgi:two-component system NarL family response regulator